MNALIGSILITFGGFSSASVYVPFFKMKGWAWETFFVSQGFVAWIILPQIGGWLTTPDRWAIIFACPIENLVWTYFFGVLYGIGCLTCGLGLRYLGMSLGNSLELGLCAVFGTLIPPVFAGTARSRFTTVSGLTVMVGVLVCLIGTAVCGYAGLLKERLLTGEQKTQGVSQKEFAFWKGILVAVIGGCMSASMAFALEAGKPIAKAALAAGTPDVFKNMPVLIVALAGDFTTNLFAAFTMHARNRTFHNYVTGPRPRLMFNYLLAALAGILWYGQFFFYGMGTTKMGKYDFSSWTIFMSFIIIGGNLWGIVLKEWKLVNRRTWVALWVGIAVLIISNVIIGWGNSLAAR